MTQNRLLSLDVMRGLTVIGMVVVNSAAVFHFGTGAPVFDILLHAPWHGITLADLVFPFFIFMVGVSIPFSLSGEKRKGVITRETALRVIRRGAVLFVIGWLLTASLADWSEPIRLLGVLQRIGLTFIAASFLYLVLSKRMLMAVVVLILVAYDLLALLPIPDAASDYLKPGQNFSSWLDRAVLGPYIYNPGAELPFEPEGLLGTLPSVAQAIIGVLVGRWLKRHERGSSELWRFVTIGFTMVLAGCVWSMELPPVKAIWSTAFVLQTSGWAMILFAALYWFLDVRQVATPGTAFTQAFGVNAITAYVLHTYLMSPMLTSMPLRDLHGVLSGVLPPEIAALPGLVAVVLATWLPLWIMKRFGITLKV